MCGEAEDLFNSSFVKRYRGLYICKTLNKAMNADVNAVVNMIDNLEAFGRDNWVVANPLVVKATLKPSNPFKGGEDVRIKGFSSVKV